MHRFDERGVTLLDTIVGIALMLVIFLGIAGVFKLSVDVVTTNKARSGAVALANERMEYIRSLSYSSIGTSGGVPSGSIAQSESVVLNGVTYTRRTVIEYADDPKDGSGSSDSNSITADYKAVKVDVAWTSRLGTRHITLVSRFEPPNGMEIACTPPCGTLTLSVVNAASSPLSGASISIVNPSTTPAISINTFSNASGTATLIGAPAASGYRITVTQTGYSTAQTYSATAQNTNPSPGHLTVANNQTTSGSFAIDTLASKIVRSWTQIQTGTTTDSFSNATGIATSSATTVSGGQVVLDGSASSGFAQSTAIAPAYLYAWKQVSWTNTKPSGTSIVYRVYDASGSTLVPDSQLPGNSAGFTSSPVSLSGVSTSTYQGLRVQGTLTTTGTTSPAIDAWNVSYDYGPQPLPNIAFSMQGAKAIGSGSSGTVYKYSQTLSTGASASLSIPNLEWDTYLITVNGTTTGYDIASSCSPQPEALSPGASQTTNLYFAAHTAHSLLVDVRSSATGALISGATVRLYKTGYDTTLSSDTCGQAFFSGLSSGTYSISVSKSGYTTYTSSAVSVSGTSKFSVSL